MRGTSNAPMILGILGSVLMLPTLLCALTCGSIVDSLGGTGGSMSTFAFLFFAPPIIIGIIGGVKGKTNPNLSFILLLCSALCAFVGWAFTMFTSIYALAPMILFLIGAILAKTQKKE